MAVNPEALKSRRNWVWSVPCLTSISFALLLLCPTGGSGEEALTHQGSRSVDDWITMNKDYSSQRYVDLDQITPANVGNLKEVCEIRLNEPIWFNSGLLKVGRTLYANTTRVTYAFDAATCDLRWRYMIDFKQTSATANNRGSGYFEGRIFRGTGDGRVIALDANTGRLLWDMQAANPAIGETFNSAPVAWQGKVFIGIAASDSGIAGRLMAFDADTGNQLWHFNTTLDSPSGGGLWTTYSLDPLTGEVFAPVANPYPDFNRDIVPDDKTFTIYTDSVISVDGATGKLNWHFQAVPHDEHDWDLGTAPTLYRTSAGKTMLAITGKSGRVYGIDRAIQSLAFNTPATTVENDQEPLNDTWMHVCPGLQGGSQFNGPAYQPRTDALYVGMGDHCAWYVKNKNIDAGAGGGGTVVKDWPAAAKLQAPRGWITAIDGKSGVVRWQYQTESQVQAGLVTTKSGLLLAGDTHGNLLIFDATNGSLLKSIDTGGALNSGLISYLVGGVQYVAAAVGGVSENPSRVAGPLRVSIYSLQGSDTPKVVTLDRFAPTSGQLLYAQVCAQCHSPTGGGGSAPPLFRQSQLADPELLKQFLATVPPPMPHLYPGLLTDNEVQLIADFLKATIFNCGPNEPQSCQPPAKPMTGGTRAWRAVYSVLTSPRCINCHPVNSPNLPTYAWNTATNAGYPQDYPRQGDDRHPHYYTVLRGDTFAFPTAEGTGTVYPGMGTPFERCTFCHGSKNDPVTGIPGTTNPEGADPAAPFWALAPASMAWESVPGVPLNGAPLCANLLNKQLNGNREPKDLLHHLATEPLVHWSFHPGTRPNGEPRTTPPISQDELIQWFKIWIAEGTPCPSS